MRRAILILVLLLVLSALYFWSKKETIQEPAQPETPTQTTYNQALRLLKEKNYAALQENMGSLQPENQTALRKKIYFHLLSALNQGNHTNVKALKVLYDTIPSDPHLNQSLNQILNHYDEKALLSQTPPLLLADDKNRLKTYANELLLTLLAIDSEDLSHTDKILEDISPLYTEQELGYIKREIALLAPYFKHHPEKALQILELSPHDQEEILSKLILTEHKGHLNHYLKYASHKGLLLTSSYKPDYLHSSALENLEFEDYEEALEDLELLSRLDPTHTDARKSYAMALYMQNEFKLVLEELKGIDNLEDSLKEMRALSEIKVGDPKLGIEELKSLSKTKSDDSKRYLALNYFNEGQYKKALIKLNRIKNIKAEDQAFAAYLDYKMRRFNRAEKQIKLIRPSVRNSESIRALELDILLAQEKLEHSHEISEKPLTSYEAIAIYQPLFSKIREEVPLHISLFKHHKRMRDPIKALAVLEEAPHDTLTNYQRLELLLEANKFDEAYPLIIKLLNDDSIPADKKALIEKWAGLIFFKQGRPIDAWAHFSKFLKLEPTSKDLIDERIETLYQIKRYDLAWELMAQLDRTDSDFLLMKLNLAYLLEKLSDFDELFNLLWERKDSFSQKQNIEFARILFLDNRTKLAQQVIPKQDIAPENIPSFLTLSVMTANFKNADPLQPYLEKDPSFDAKKALGYYYYRLNDRAASLENYKKALKIKPYDLEIQTQVASFDRSYEDIVKDTAALSSQIEKTPGILSDQLLLVKNYILEGYARKKESPDSFFRFSWDKAHSIIEKLVQIEPSIPEFYIAEGQIKDLTDDSQKAISDFKKALELSVTSPEASRYLALAYVKNKKSRDAVKVLDEALNQTAYDPDLWAALGNLQKNMGNTLEAMDAWKNYSLLKPKDPKGYESLADLSASLNNPEDAIKSLKKAIELDPKNDLIRKKLKKYMADPLLNLNNPERKSLEELTR